MTITPFGKTPGAANTVLPSCRGVSPENYSTPRLRPSTRKRFDKRRKMWYHGKSSISGGRLWQRRSFARPAKRACAAGIRGSTHRRSRLPRANAPPATSSTYTAARARFSAARSTTPARRSPCACSPRRTRLWTRNSSAAALKWRGRTESAFATWTAAAWSIRNRTSCPA